MKQIYILIFTIIISFILLFCFYKYEQFYVCDSIEKDNLNPFNIYGFTSTENNKLVIKINYNTNKFICYFNKILIPNREDNKNIDIDIEIKHFLVINSLSSKFNKIKDITPNPNINGNQKITHIKEGEGGNREPSGKNPNNLNLDPIYNNIYIEKDIDSNEIYEINIILIYIDSTATQDSINKITDNNKISMSKTLIINASAPKIINNKYSIIKYKQPTNLIDNLKGKKFNINIK